MRIALVHYSAAPVIGGVERVMEEHARLFARHGNEVDVLTRGSALPRHDLAIVHNVMTMPFDPAFTAALAEAAGKGGRFIAWTHDIAACHPDLAPGPEICGKAHAGFEYVAVSELRRCQLREVLGVEARVVPNGIDPARVLGLPENVARLAEKFSLFGARPVLLHPARLLRRKNVEFSLSVAAAMNAVLLVTGADDPHNAASREYAAWLRDERARLGADAIFVSEHFPVGDAELAGLYALADALIFPSRSEGFGLPVLEAAFHRLPVFCADIEPLRSIAPHAKLFPVDARADDVARMIGAVLGKDGAHLARKTTLAEYSWETIYTRHIAPLLAERRTD